MISDKYRCLGPTQKLLYKFSRSTLKRCLGSKLVPIICQKLQTFWLVHVARFTGQR